MASKAARAHLWLALAVAFLCLWNLSLSEVALARGGLGTLISTPMQPEPSPHVLRAWNRDLFGTNEAWLIKNRRTFFARLNRAGLSSLAFEELSRQWQDLNSLSFDDNLKLKAFHKLESVEGVIFVPPSLKDRLPYGVLQETYRYLFETNNFWQLWSFASESEAVTYIKFASLSESSAIKVLRRIFKVKDKYHVSITPDLWQDLKASQKKWIIDDALSKDPAQRGLRLELTFDRDDDIAAIADHYAGEREPRPLERRLRAMLEWSSTGQVTIPLETILHPFITRHVNTYSVCSGPNCFNAGLSVNQGTKYKRDYLSVGDAVFAASASMPYQFVKASEPLRAGDLLLYQDVDGQIVHASTYITEDIVFTKNGLSKFAPYVFQYKALNEHAYFPQKDFALSVLRVPRKSEVRPSKTPSWMTKETTPYRDFRCESFFQPAS